VATAVILGRVGLSKHNLNPRITTMTDDKIALRELLEKGSDATFLREMIGFAAQRLMELETEAVCGAGHGERSPERVNQRNGYRECLEFRVREGVAHDQAIALVKRSPKRTAN
jgi:hypothetical protein